MDLNLPKNTEENNVALESNDSEMQTTTAVFNRNEFSNPSSNSIAVFTAIKKNSIEMLNILLQQPDINLNIRNFCGETPLLMAILYDRSFSFVVRLIESGSDVNVCGKDGATPLLLAIHTGANKIAYELLKRGADVNAESIVTPLYETISHSNLKGVCLLLYYGAEVRDSLDNKDTCLMLAFENGNAEIVKSLIRYYYEFSDEVIPNGNTNFELPYPGMIESENFVLCKFSFMNGYYEAFKLFWSRCEQKELYYLGDLLLVKYMEECSFAPSKWLECLFLILASPRALLWTKCYFSFRCEDFLIALLDDLDWYEMEQNDIVASIFMCLSIGIEVTIHHIEWIYRNYGYNEELEALIYTGNYQGIEHHSDAFPLLHYVIDLKEDYSTEKIFGYFKKQLTDAEDPTSTFAWFTFFSLPSCMKIELINSQIWNTPEEQTFAFEHINNTPEFPSLLELSRNQAQKFIRETHQIRKLYQFHGIVKNLCLPEHLKHIILFKRAIYKQVDN